MDPGMTAGPTQLDRLALPHPDDGAHTLGHHECTDNPEQNHVGNTDGDIELADCAKRGEKPDTKGGAHYAAREQHEGEGEIDRPAEPTCAYRGERASPDDARELARDSAVRRAHSSDVRRARHACAHFLLCRTRHGKLEVG